MPTRPPWPPGVMHFGVTVDVDSEPAAFGLWLYWPSTSTWDDTMAEAVINDFIVNPMPYFLDCMYSGATIRTCRIRLMGTQPFSWTKAIAPNAGAISGSMPYVSAAGVYVQSTGGGRGSGTRIRVPAIGDTMAEPPGRLSAYGVQQLTFLAGAVGSWPTTLSALGLGPAVLGTLQTRDGGSLLPTPVFDPALAVRPSLELETMVARGRSFSRISGP